MKKLKNIITIAVLIFLTSLNNIVKAQITVTKQDVTCYNCSDGKALIKVEGGTPPYEYIWEDGFSGKTRNGLAPGYYVVVVADSNDCTGSIGFTIGNRPRPPRPFRIFVVASRDPNDITGPAGYGSEQWVSVNDVLPYRIRFENDPKLATAPVNKVVVTFPVPEKANLFSFRLKDISFRGFTIDMPENANYYSKRLNLADSIGVFIDVTAGLDVTKHEAFWIFQAIDPATGLPNTDPEKGFLLINDSINHMGEGEVNFTIKPSVDAATGDTINAFADIVFDINENLRTNIARNLIDAHPPISKILSLESISSDIMKVNWKGNDDAYGSGLEEYTLLVSSNNEPYVSFATTSDTSTTFKLNGGNEYRLQTISRDYTGNDEAIKPEPDTIFYLKPHVNLGKDFSICLNDSVELNAGSGFDSYLWNNGSYGRTLVVKTAGTYYVTAVLDSVTVSDTIVIGVNPLPVPALHLNTTTFCDGTSLTLDAGDGFKEYLWNTLETTQTIETTSQGKFIVTVTDFNGCVASDSITVSMLAKPSFSLGNDIFIEVGDTVFLAPVAGGFSSYLWNNNSTGSSLMIIGKQANIGTTQYWLRVTNANGCQNSDTVAVTVSPATNIRFVGEEITSVHIYPNPVSDILNLDIINAGNGDIKIELYTIDGKLISVKQYPYSPVQISDQINMSYLSYGSYIIKATYKDREISKTIIKE